MSCFTYQTLDNSYFTYRSDGLTRADLLRQIVEFDYTSVNGCLHNRAMNSNL